MKILKSYLIILKLFIFCFSVVNCSEDVVDVGNRAILKGIIVKHRTNEPLANVKISTSPTTNTVFSASDGSFEITDMPIGDYSVKAELQGYLNEIIGVNFIDHGQVVNIVFEMKDDNSLNSPPSVPELLTPADNSIDHALSVNLTWNATDPDNDSIIYKLIVKNNKNDDIMTIHDITTKNYTLENLNYGTAYFWQIAASDGINEEVNSPTYKFTTSSLPQNRFHYARLEGQNYVIYSSNEEGASFKLTNTNVNSIRPRKNNSAGLVSFLRVSDGNTHLYVTKPDGSDEFRVTQIPLAGFNNNELDYAWSANGSEFIYPNYNKLYKINKDGSGTQLLYTTHDGSFISECAWSNDGSKIVLKTNNIDGYNVKIFMIDLVGNTIKTILENVNGAAGGLDISVDGTKILYTHDISGYQSNTYRVMQSHIFIYDLLTDTATDLSSSSEIPNGFIDIDPRFSPNEAEVIFTQTSNDGISMKDVYKISLGNDDSNTRTLLFSNACMPDWE